MSSSAAQTSAPAADPIPVVAPSAHPWTRPEPFRVHHYDASRKGTWFAFFTTIEEAQAFAVGKRVWGKPAAVESKGVAS